ncbi:MAG TPA: hypothetical protein DCZ69_17225 [Syntrophobacteraceae bacterium]|nr:hypothetical protein [Syntrophobacteraceae bacterium]
MRRPCTPHVTSRRRPCVTLIECIPNFSEGRRPEVLDQIAAAVTGVDGVHLLDVQSDATHNRCVVTFVGHEGPIPEAAFRALEAHDWPGNVRELENVIERAVVLSTGSAIGVDLVPDQVRSKRDAPAEPTHTMEEMEKQHILSMLEREQWNIARTSRVLDIDRTTLHKKIKKYGLERP